ncbi:unnamed protein product [Taenia asiatica]|uniref:Molecular chaperone DnaK n=1 Tax=Taenia asiatica TaxID=60517 RepID=A0A0R3WHI7_TAEAS|nr:unnamed protein product [Taenia asiatica]
MADKRIRVCIRDSGHLSEEQIELMINEAEKLKQEDKKQGSKMTTKIMLEKIHLLYAVRNGRRRDKAKDIKEAT